MSKSSIHIEPVKPNSESHNEREKDLDYVRKDLSDRNEFWKAESISSRLERIKTNYTKSVGRRMHSRSTPIREGVVLIKEDTKMEELSKLADELKGRFNLNVFQIHIHRDEGHWETETKEWIPNLHAHFVFDWTEEITGISIKLNRKRMSEMQTLVAEELGMERGVSSDKKHIDAYAYKLEQERKKINELLDRHKKWEKEISLLRPEIENASDAIIKRNSLGIINEEKTKWNIESILIENKELKRNLEKSRSSVEELRNSAKGGEKLHRQVIDQIEKLRTNLKEAESNVLKIISAPESEQMDLFKSLFPHLLTTTSKDKGMGR